ncbi:MAG: type I glyceraldehyde-3-phosphate dehydrogenase [Planctomycetota bacterium]|nr:MAG: type I glyceraldehyde-3-phosphate dehydrogenase [Planctomycetota bacterium]
MTISLAISGMGEIGRTLFRCAFHDPEFEICALAHPTTPEALAYLINYDTIYSRFPEKVKVDGEFLVTSKGKVRILSGEKPGELDWKSVGATVVLDSTEKFRTQESLEGHFQRGAQKVVITVPPRDQKIPYFIESINDNKLSPEISLFSAGSATAHCLLPALEILHQEVGIETAMMTVARAYTSEQSLLDKPGPDLRLSRAAAQNVIPSVTWSVLAANELLPHLHGAVDGMSMEVPVPDGSLVDIVALLKKSCSPQEINQIFLKHSKEGPWSFLLDYCEDPIVSTDVINNPHSCVVDSLATAVIQENLAKILVWYDNFWSFSNRILSLIKKSFKG